MERALGFLLSGKIYLNDGSNWNDTDDSAILKKRKLYAKCFSWSTRENIAMWMLYGDSRGKNGAMLSFPPSVMHELLECPQLELGFFDNGKFQAKRILYNSSNDYDIFLSDVIYYDPVANGKCVLTLYDEHVTVDKEVAFGYRDIFIKNYAWEYERECRLLVRLNLKWQKIAEQEGLNTICVVLSNKAIIKMRKRDLIRSPIYNGKVDNGKNSVLSGKVNWNI